jgi:hypothetical protein
VSKEERELDDTLRSAFQSLARAKGPCPSNEELAKLLTDEAEHDEAVRRHVEACGVCEVMLEQLRLFEGPEPSERHRGRGAAIMDGIGRLLLHPAFAYATAAAVLIVAAVGVVPFGAPHANLQSPAVTSAPAMSAARVIDLNAWRGSQPEQPVPADDTVILRFTVPTRSEHRYIARILDSDQQALGETALGSCDAFGNCEVVLRPRQLGGGARMLRVIEYAGSTTVAGRQFDFPLPF